jgi:hypothetical protein
MLTILSKIPGLDRLIPKEPAAVIGIVYSAVVALLWIFLPGTAAEVVSLAGPILAALHIRTKVFAPATVAQIDAALTDQASVRVAAALRAQPPAVATGPPKPRGHVHPPGHRKK